MSILITVVAFLAALGCLIVVHEFGHYLAARACGVKVLRFSVGFGKPLWMKPLGRDGTEWVIAAFPLGGYVKMLDEREGPVAREDLPRAFNRQSVWRRLAVVIAGPAANFLLAIVLYWVLFIHGVPGIRPVIGEPPQGTPAHQAGFVAGDTLMKIGDEPVATWQDARWILLQRAVQRDNVTIDVRSARGDPGRRKLDLSGLTSADLDSDFLRALGLGRYQPELPPEIGRVTPGGAADRAGLKAGDEIFTINSRQIKSIDQAIRLIRDHPEKTLIFVVKRNGETLPAFAVVPDPHREKSGVPVGRINAVLQVKKDAFAAYLVEVRYGAFESIGKAMYKTWDMSIFTLKMLGKMVIGEVSLKNLSGPITIADYAGQSAQGGFASYLLFLALISISLGVLNLLPIPLLDGGHLMYYMFEVLKGSPVSDRAIEIGQHVGMALLFTLMAFALYNDINRLISG